MERELTPETRRKLAGFLHFEDGEGVPVTPPEFKDVTPAPKYFIRPYGKEALKRRREWSRAANAAPVEGEERKGYAEMLVELFAAGEGLMRWEDVLSASGREVPYSRAAVERLASVEKLLAWLDLEILELTAGPSPEEREALG